jgi:hypothetical protein
MLVAMALSPPVQEAGTRNQNVNHGAGHTSQTTEPAHVHGLLSRFLSRGSDRSGACTPFAQLERKWTMTDARPYGPLLLVLAVGLAGCDGATSALPTRPSASPLPPQPAAPTLVVFAEQGTGFSTTDVRDVHDQILQFNTANELIWTADGTRLPGYRVDRCCYPGVSFIVGRICPVDCAFEVRFGTKDGERRAYLTVDYGHDNPGTIADVEVADGALVVTRTGVFLPGSFTLSGFVTEATEAGIVPVEGVSVYRSEVSGYRQGTTDRNGFYSILGMFNGAGSVTTIKEGFARTQHGVLIDGDTKFDIQLVRQ